MREWGEGVRDGERVNESERERVGEGVKDGERGKG